MPGVPDGAPAVRWVCKSEPIVDGTTAGGSIRTLTDATIDEVLERLGFGERPDPDLEGLTAVYRAWCRRVPFDNLRKLVALHYDMPDLPGIDPADFFAAWLLTGAGGTCWPSNNALHALLAGLGFDAELHAASMWDLDEDNHGTTLVTVGATRFMVDSSVLSDAPVPLVEGQPAEVAHGGYVVRATPDPGGWLVRFPTAQEGIVVPCRLRHPMDHIATVDAYERSRAVSPFNDDITARVNDRDGVWVVRGRTITRVTAGERTTREAPDTEVDDFLVDEIGYIPQLVAEVRGVLRPDP